MAFFHKKYDLRQPKLEVAENISKAQDTKEEKKESLKWEAAVGKVALEYAYLYPPGSPIIVPGERLTREAVRLLEWYLEHGFSIEGLMKEGYIEVLKSE